MINCYSPKTRNCFPDRCIPMSTQLSEPRWVSYAPNSWSFKEPNAPNVHSLCYLEILSWSIKHESGVIFHRIRCPALRSLTLDQHQFDYKTSVASPRVRKFFQNSSNVPLATLFWRGSRNRYWLRKSYPPPNPEWDTFIVVLWRSSPLCDAGSPNSLVEGRGLNCYPTLFEEFGPKTSVLTVNVQTLGSNPRKLITTNIHYSRLRLGGDI